MSRALAAHVTAPLSSGRAAQSRRKIQLGYFLFGSVLGCLEVQSGHKQLGMDRATTNSLVPFQPFQPGRMKLRHSYNAATLMPPSSSNRQHHAHEAAYPRCKMASCIHRREHDNPSPRKGIAVGADACTPTLQHHHKPPREKLLQPSSVFCQLLCWQQQRAVQ